MAGDPNFNNLGVNDPITGQPVYLSSENISNVLGATGGVAPTKFQAGTAGFFKGLGQGQEFVGNVSNIQAQQQSIAQSKAQTDRIDIQNDILRKTADAQITSQNNQLLQHGIQAKMSTDKLTADNTVLQAIQSGDSGQLAKVVADPKLQLSAYELDPYVQGAISNFRASGSLPPDHEAAFKHFETARDIFHAAPLQDSYNQAAAVVKGSIPFQQLKSASGLPDDQLLQGMQIKQGPQGALGGAQTKLVAPNGAEVLLDDASKDKHNEMLSGFYTAKAALDRVKGLQTPPVPASASATAAPGGLTERNLPVGAGAPTSQLDPSTQVAKDAAQPTPTPTAAPQANPNDKNAATLAPTNPNNIGPTGQVIGKQTQPALAWQNSHPTYDGSDLSSSIARNAMQMHALSPVLAPKDIIRNATKESLAQAKFDDEITSTLTKDTVGANAKLKLSEEIKAASDLAKKLEYPLGPSTITHGQQFIAGLSISGDADKLSDYNYMLKRFDNIKATFAGNTLTQSGIAASELRSGMIENKILGGTPGLDSPPEYLEDVSTALKADAGTTYRINDLTRYLLAQKTQIGQVKSLVSEYLADPNNQSIVYDSKTGRPVQNPNITDPIDWIKKKQGVDLDQEVKDTFAAPSTLPAEAKNSAQPTTAGSGTGTPFAPAQKQTPGAFPASTPQAGVRGVNYEQTPATGKDIQALLDTATSGGNLAQYQQAGSVPLKLDKVTPDLLSRIIMRESSGDPNASAGREHIGLMQVGRLAFKDAQKTSQQEFDQTITDRGDTKQNLVGGATYVNQQLKRYDGNVDLALAAYKDGPPTVDRILKEQKLSTARATIQQIAPFLPNSDGANTAKYVQDITGRGRVQSPATKTAQAAQPSASPVSDFFHQMNPFEASTAQAEEPTSPAEMTPEQKKAAGWQPDPNAGPNGETQIFIGGSSNQNTSPTGSGTPPPAAPTVSPSEATTTDAAAKVPEVQPSLRNYVPPISQLAPALAASKAQAQGQPTPGFTERTLAKMKDTAFGRFLFDPKNEDIFGSGENMLNAATYGLYDEGMGLVGSALGMDGGSVRDGIRDELKQFRKDYPKTSVASDIFGSVAGGAGAGLLFKSLGPALRITKVAAPEFGGMTIGQGLKIGSAQGAAQSFGNAEGGVKNRLLAAGIGGTIGAATGGVTAGIGVSPGGVKGLIGGAAIGSGVGGAVAELSGKPVVPGMMMGAGVGAGLGVAGRPGMVGAGLGLAAGAMTGDPANAVLGAAGGTVLGTGLAMTAMKSPVVQKALARMATRANNSIGLKTFLSMATEVLSGKTPAEIQANLTPVQAFIAKQIKHLSDSEIQGMIEELKNGHPDIPQRLVDVLNSRKLNTFTKLVRDVADDPETSQKVATFLSDRVANIKAGITTEMDASLSPEHAARMFLGLIDDAKGNATEDARLATEHIYAFAKQQTPTFDSPTMKQLMTSQTVKDAIAAARKKFEDPRTELDLAKELRQTHLGNERGTIQEIYDRMMAGLPVDEQLIRLANLSKTLPDTSYEIMTRAQRIIKSWADDAAKLGDNTHALDIGDIGRAVEKEMGIISEPWKNANVLYGNVLAKTDLLRKNDIIKAMSNLKDGNVEAALPKLVKLPVDDLNELMQIIPDKGMFKELAKNYLSNKLSGQVAKGNVAEKLVSDSEWKRLAPMLGDEAQGFKSYLESQASIYRTGTALGAGSHTVPMGQALPELRAAGGEESMHDIAHLSGGSVHSILGRVGQTLIKTMGASMNKQFIKDLGETLVLNADKGVEGLQQILAARGASAKEIEALGPTLTELQAAFRAGTLNVPNAFLQESPIMKPFKENKNYKKK